LLYSQNLKIIHSSKIDDLEYILNIDRGPYGLSSFFLYYSVGGIHIEGTMPVRPGSVQCGYNFAMMAGFWGTMTFMTITGLMGLLSRPTSELGHFVLIWREI
jgi:hypothetical protein